MFSVINLFSQRLLRNATLRHLRRYIMVNPPKSKHIPRATIQRLATYVQVLENFARDNVEVISSNPLAEACGVNGSQVRKDLAYFGEFGIRGVGYHVKSLIAAITSSLGVDREWRMEPQRRARTALFSTSCAKRPGVLLVWW